MFSRKHWYHSFLHEVARKDVPVLSVEHWAARLVVAGLARKSSGNGQKGPATAQAYVSGSYDSAGAIVRRSRDAMI